MTTKHDQKDIQRQFRLAAVCCGAGKIGMARQYQFRAEQMVKDNLAMRRIHTDRRGGE